MREESVPKTARVDVSLPFCKTRIERDKGVEGGSSTTQKAVKTGVYETAPGRTRPGLRKGGVNRNSACQIQGGSCVLATRGEISTVWKSVGGVVLAAPPVSDWCGNRRGGREERRRHSAATRE
jgi:hypothetical protein